MTRDTVLQVRDLSVRYEPRGSAPHDAVKSVSFDVADGEFIGLVGESGSGKSTLANAILRLTERPANMTSGTVMLDGVNLADVDDDQLRRLRWADLSTVFQSSMNSLNPVITVGAQFTDTFAAHREGRRASSADDRARAAALLEMVSLDAAVLRSFPHELSGGMKQRVALALALALEPKLVILDEPTTGLDVLVQRRILERLRELQGRFGFAVLFVSHDIGTVLEIADRVLVMYQGEIVEEQDAEALLENPRDDYTRRLLASYAESREIDARSEVTAEPKTVLVVDEVSKRYGTKRGRGSQVQALDHVSMSLYAGRISALVGQSGSGKSTLARMLIGIERPDEGSIRFGDTQIEKLRGRALRDFRRNAQYVFQDPYSSLNPTRTVRYILGRPLRNFAGVPRTELDGRIRTLLESVGLSADRFIDKLPHQLSGGQRQRVVIARALAPEPTILIADEPVSSLDVTIRADILDLLKALVDEKDLAMLYITHDLLSARAIAHDVTVLREGRVIERGETGRVTERPEHEYTRELLAAVPDPYTRRLA